MVIQNYFIPNHKKILMSNIINIISFLLKKYTFGFIDKIILQFFQWKKNYLWLKILY